MVNLEHIEIFIVFITIILSPCVAVPNIEWDAKNKTCVFSHNKYLVLQPSADWRDTYLKFISYLE